MRIYIEHLKPTERASLALSLKGILSSVKYHFDHQVAVF